MRQLLIIVILTFWTTEAFGAVEPRGDLHPLLRVNAELFRPGGLNPGLPDEVEHRDIFIAKGGFTNSLLVLRGREAFETILVRGQGTNERLAALNRALGASRVGLQRDCQILTDPTGAQVPPSIYRINWYGKGTRTNQFQIILDSSQAEGVPGCSIEVKKLLEAIILFENSVANHPDSEVIVSD
jgi:hypothetical protein